MAPIERKYRFNMMLSNDEERMLRELAERRGLTASDLLRQFVREAYAADDAASDARLERTILELLNNGPRDASALVPTLIGLRFGDREKVPGMAAAAMERLRREGLVKRDVARHCDKLTPKGQNAISNK
jgi:hypothetical protein